MRILRVAQKIYPEVKGGGAYHVHAMSRDQAEMGHDVTVLTTGDGPTVETRDGYTLRRCKEVAAPLGNGIAPGLLRHLRQAGNYDVVHAHSHLYASTNLAALCARLGDFPLAITNHGLYSQNTPEWVFDIYLRTLGRWTFNQADVVFCYTEADRDRLAKQGVDSRVAVVPNGIDTERFYPTGPTHDGVAGTPSILFVGRLVDGKCPLDAVEVLAALREHYPDVALTVVGTGPLRDRIHERAAELNVSAGVAVLGQVPYDEMPSVYRAADALLLPSRAEGLPRTVLEALACDIPVVASDLPQIVTVLDEVGQAVAVGDIDGFADALRTVLSHDEISPRSNATEYSWNQTVERTTDQLNRIASPRVTRH